MKDLKNSKGIALIMLIAIIIILIAVVGVGIYFILGIDKNNKDSISSINSNNENTTTGVVESENKTNHTNLNTGNYAPYNKPYIPQGFVHVGTETWNNGYTIKESSTGNEFVWVPCVTNENQIKPGDNVVVFKRLTSSMYIGQADKITGDDENSHTHEIESNVEKYGGFYIARYEAGLPNTTQSTESEDAIKSDFTQKPVSKAGVGVWNFISRADAITVSNSMISTEDGVKSTLISGAAWDTTLQWIINASDNKDNEPNKRFDTNSVGKGWYYDISSNKPHVTGYFSVNNIYDMAGNVSEWTSENCTWGSTSGYVMQRGGAYNATGQYSYAANRSSGHGNSSRHIGFRVILYKEV